MTGYVRHIALNDMPAIMRIEGQAFRWPWTAKHYHRHFRCPSTRGLAVEIDQRVEAIAMFELDAPKIHLVRMAVDPAYRGRGLGTGMLRRLVDVIQPPPGSNQETLSQFDSIELRVCEYNEPAIAWFRRRGFRGVGMLAECYECDGEAIEMAYRRSDREAQAVIDSIMLGQGLAVRIAH